MIERDKSRYQKNYAKYINCEMHHIKWFLINTDGWTDMKKTYILYNDEIDIMKCCILFFIWGVMW